MGHAAPRHNCKAVRPCARAPQAAGHPNPAPPAVPAQLQPPGSLPTHLCALDGALLHLDALQVLLAVGGPGVGLAGGAGGQLGGQQLQRPSAGWVQGRARALEPTPLHRSPVRRRGPPRPARRRPARARPHHDVLHAAGAHVVPGGGGGEDAQQRGGHRVGVCGVHHHAVVQGGHDVHGAACRGGGEGRGQAGAAGWRGGSAGVAAPCVGQGPLRSRAGKGMQSKDEGGALQPSSCAGRQKDGSHEAVQSCQKVNRRRQPLQTQPPARCCRVSQLPSGACLPFLVATVGTPCAAASMTVRPNGSCRAMFTNTPRVACRGVWGAGGHLDGKGTRAAGKSKVSAASAGNPVAGCQAARLP